MRGVFAIVKNKAAITWIETGKDPSGLGRWVWTRHRGKNNITLYRTCIPNNSLGQHTIHKQQLRYLSREKDDRSPRQALLEDLAEDIKQAQASGDQIILMIDLNEHVRSPAIIEFAEGFHLREAITERHTGREGFAPTHQRGSHPIDGIFISSTLHIQNGG